MQLQQTKRDYATRSRKILLDPHLLDKFRYVRTCLCSACGRWVRLRHAANCEVKTLGEHYNGLGH
jgi:hypothetical protein